MALRAIRKLAVGLAAGYAATKSLDETSKAIYRRQRESREREEEIRDEMPTVVFVRKIASWRGMKLDDEREQQLANVVHMGLGISGGPAAQLLASRSQLGLFASGLAVAGAMFVFIDEGLNYVLGLTAPATEWPVATHARGLAAHAAYGVTLGSILAVGNRTLFRS